MPKKNVLIVMLSDRFEGLTGPDRWQQWRSVIELCRHPHFYVHRVMLVYSQPREAMAHLLRSDIVTVNPYVDIELQIMNVRDKNSLSDGFLRLLNIVDNYSFDYENEEYFIRFAAGTAYAGIASGMLMITSGYINASLITLDPPIVGEPKEGIVRIFKPDIGEWLQMAQNIRREKLQTVSFLKAGIETKNPHYNALLMKIEHVTLNTTAPMLLTGPTGSGKTFLAKRIYLLKKKNGLLSGDFVAVNCSTLIGDTALSALFGHVKGAFTGAHANREGYLRAANGGILFLDEVGDLPPDCQARLLTALEQKQFYPMGSDVMVGSNFQLICGTNKALAGEVAAGHFREDLFGRINVWHFNLPALRDRPEDIEPNLTYEAERLAGLLGRKISFTSEARQVFLSFATSPEALWRGNFRDLAGSLERMGTLAVAGIVTPNLVEQEISLLNSQWQALGTATESTPASQGSQLNSQIPKRFPVPMQTTFSFLQALLPPERWAEMDYIEKIQLQIVVEACRQSPTRSQAGKILYGASRAQKKRVNDTDRLNKFLQKYKLTWDQVKE